MAKTVSFAVNGIIVKMDERKARNVVLASDALRESLERNPKPGTTPESRQRTAERRALSLIASGR